MRKHLLIAGLFFCLTATLFIATASAFDVHNRSSAVTNGRVFTSVHDVAIINITAFPPFVPRGEPVYIEVTVENQGDFPETFNVTVYADRMGGSPVHIHIENRTVSLDVGESKILEFVWDTTDVPYGSYWITAEAILPLDEDPEDNIARTFIAGICVPTQKPRTNLLAQLVQVASMALINVVLGMVAIGSFKILGSERLRWS